MSTAVRAEFDRLYAGLYKRTCFHSGPQALEDPAYAQLVALGPGIVPILRERLAEPTLQHWVFFPILRDVLGTEGPDIPHEHVGRCGEISKDWLNWLDAQQVAE